jgi:hypothetical protein
MRYGACGMRCPACGMRHEAGGQQRLKNMVIGSLGSGSLGVGFYVRTVSFTWHAVRGMRRAVCGVRHFNREPRATSRKPFYFVLNYYLYTSAILLLT